jgi:DNA repair protein RecO (recombination protein O)
VGQHVGESLILRTYPLKESDLIVSFLTRESGKLRGVANRARKPKSGFGAGLERLSHVRLAYFQKENRDLVRIDSAELIRAHFSPPSYDHSLALDFMAEVSELLLPAHEVNEKYFRLLLAVMADLEATPPESIWKALTYFALWSVRLQGFLPDIPICDASREIAAAMLRTPVAGIPCDGWNKKTAADLRRALIGLIEEHSERRLITTRYLEAL